MVKKNTYIDVELDWAEKQLASWKEYVDSHPINELTDRIHITSTGKVTVVATIEQQGKFIQETMKNYVSLLKDVQALRKVEQYKKEARGSEKIPYRMRKNDEQQ